MNSHWWGRRPPEDATLAWGARAIYNDVGSIELLWDRQSWRGGSKYERKALADWVDVQGLPAIKEACVFDELKPSEGRFVGWRDERGELTRIIEASPNASHGYLYLVAYEVAEATPNTQGAER